MIKEKQAKHLTFYACDNSLLLTSQTTSRVSKIDGTRVKIISSKASKETGFKTLLELKTAIFIDETVDIVAFCANSTQWKNINEIIKLLPKHKFTASFYIDEADKIACSPTALEMIKNWEKTLKDHISSICFITATPSPHMHTPKIIKTRTIKTLIIHQHLS